ncbi:glycosyltransferase family 4 protein [Seonamhaeicola sediminis]|uniref:Glycosyltransferase family 4 protein n=1 Tax=Seonamhaeicola sediminis TaxID=2528206 RepID=A0A562YGH4_9FLAO|nr:glycosyltransferase family 4 protein [Seonamhaeicola sediminis]TWO33977.1 glycosyltransferase family 4 protein [Seonamhaeicola sediminis]
MNKRKLVRITTVPLSLDKLLEDQLRFMNNHYEVTAISSDIDYLKKVGEKEGVNVFNVELTRKITPIKDLRALFKLIRYLIKTKPFIVHTHTPKAGLIGMLAARIANVPIRLHTVAGLPLLETMGFKRRLLVYIEKLTYSCAKRVYPNSFGLKKIIEDQILSSGLKLKVIGNGSSNGINTDYFNIDSIQNRVLDDLRKRLNITPKDFVYIFVGRIVRDKGINEILESFKVLYEKYSNIKLLLVGPFEDELDPIEIESRQIIKDNKNIITTGYKRDVRPYFAISNVLVFPSYREGFPNVVMQAGAMSLPSIVSDINGCNEIITHNVNGSVVKVKNIEELLAEMESYFLDKQKYDRIKANSRQAIVDKYNRPYYLNSLLKEYKEVQSV